MPQNPAIECLNESLIITHISNDLYAFSYVEASNRLHFDTGTLTNQRGLTMTPLWLIFTAIRSLKRRLFLGYPYHFGREFYPTKVLKFASEVS